MNSEQRQAEYLAKALAAEDSASKATDAPIREDWLRIAAAYRQLADFHKQS